MAGRMLVVGYGNPYRRDDGVAFHIINALRGRLGQRELEPDDNGEDELGGAIDTLMLHQLLPEIAPLLKSYEKVVFVDAHAGIIPDEIRVVPVREEYGFQAVTHHMSPGMMLAVARQANGAAVPWACLVSVKGVDFDFGTELSSACRSYALDAVDKILEMNEPSTTHGATHIAPKE